MTSKQLLHLLVIFNFSKQKQKFSEVNTKYISVLLCNVFLMWCIFWTGASTSANDGTEKMKAEYRKHSYVFVQEVPDKIAVDKWIADTKCLTWLTYSKNKGYVIKFAVRILKNVQFVPKSRSLKMMLYFAFTIQLGIMNTLLIVRKCRKTSKQKSSNNIDMVCDPFVLLIQWKSGLALASTITWASYDIS